MTVTSFGDLPLADRDLEWVSDAATVMQGSRGGVDVPSTDVNRVKSHLRSTTEDGRDPAVGARLTVAEQIEHTRRLPS